MVYCGKPSRGCQMCRTRRIKCDETKPTCLQCQKSRRLCPGYKDDFDLVFRNETQATERRVKRATTASKKANIQLVQARQRQQHDGRFNLPPDHSGRAMSISSTWSDSSSATALFSPTSTSSDDSILALAASSVPGQLNTSFEAQAVHFFLSNWVLLPQQGNNRGYLDFLLPLLRTSPPDSHLALTFAATGLAALANRSSPGINSKGLLPYAAQKYEKALKRTNEALRDPVLAKQDSTLASVLLLGLFEQITSCRSNLMGWGSHIDGAVALIRMRGKKQLRTSVGKGLFIAVRTQMVVNCTSSSKPPIMGTEFWTTDAMKDLYGQEITRINLSVAELRAEVNKTMTMAPRTAANLEKVRGHIRQAQTIVERYEKWETSLPEEWMPKIAYWGGDGRPEGTEMDWHIYPGEVHTFEDLWQSTVWNMTYQSRFFLAGIVIRCSAWLCSPADYRQTPEYGIAVSLATDMIAKTIATIPYLLGWGLRDSRGRKQPATIETGEFAVGGGGFGAQKAVPRSLGGFFALWPLFTICCSDYLNDSQRRWVTGRLRWITEEMGVNQAGVLSQFQLRLPSMVIKRDGMGISYPSPREMAKNPSPTVNLPAAARPVAVDKVNCGSIGVKIKVDEESMPRSVMNNNAEGQQRQQQNHIQDMGQQHQGISREQGSSVWQPQYRNDEPTRYTSQQVYPRPEQTQYQNPTSNLHAISSSLYSQPENQQFQYQNHSQNQSSYQSSYNKPSNNESLSTYSTSSTQSMNRNASQANTTPLPLSQYQRAGPQVQINPPDMANKIDNFVSEMSSRFEGQSPSHSSRSPTSTYDSSAPPTPQSSIHNLSPEYHFNSSTSPLQPNYPSFQTHNSSPGNFQAHNYNNDNINVNTNDEVVFKVEHPPTPTASTIYNDNTHFQEYPHISNNSSSSTTHWNNTDTQDHPTTISRNMNSNANMNTNDNPTSLRSAARDPRTTAATPSGISSGGTYDYSNNRLDWEIEMMGKEVARGNELERKHFQAHLRELERQRMIE